MAKSKKTDTSESRDIKATLVKWLWILLILGLIAVAAIFMLVSYTKMPDTEELENPDYEYATVIYSADQQELGKYFSKNREGLSYEDLNPYLVNGLIATEDERFNEHSGIDVRSTLRAVLYMGGKGGASTITQQLAKQFFTKRSRSFVKRVWQKLKEWVICTQFEKRYTKEEILAMYLNKFDFIYSSSGVSAAAKTYFGKNQKDLTVDEAAMLVGMLKNPYVYNPKKNPENALTRRNVVMKQMVRNKYLTEVEYEEIKEKPLDMANFNRSNHFEGPAPYFLQTLKLNIKDILKDDKYKKNDGTSYNLDEDGLRIYTTIDMRFQKHAEAAMLQEMKKIQKNFREEWRGKDPWINSDKAQNQNRKDFLNNAVRTSERYVNMKNRVLAPVIQKIKEKFPDSRMWDTDIKRILRAEKDNKYLDKQVKNEIVRKKQATAYKKVLTDPLWKEFKRERSTLDKKAAKIFNAKTKMNIFAYNEKGEESVVMSPMDSIKYHQSLMQLGSVSIDPSTGHIKTWVGGIGNKYFKLDHVRTNRQVGSTFKPFVYATAISQAGYSPCHKIHDIRQEIPAGDPNFGLLETWAPDNSDGIFTGDWWTLKDGLKKSKNSISVGLLKEMGSVQPIRDLADKMGISKKKIPNAPSIILGSSQLNVLEMTSAYSTFANAGIHNSPTFITKIEDSDGKVIYTSIPKQKRILSEKYNEAMVNLLQYASSAVTHLLKYGEWGGKTGTTNDHVDGWFMGITPNLVVGTWVGGDVNYIRFQSLRYGSGGKMARPFFLNFMNRLENDPQINMNQNATFKVPEGDRIVTDCSQYDRPVSSKEEADEKKSIKEILEEFEDEFGGE